MADVVQDADGRIHMLNEAGSPVSVDAAEYGQAIQAGWCPQTAEEYSRHATARGGAQRFHRQPVGHEVRVADVDRCLRGGECQ